MRNCDARGQSLTRIVWHSRLGATPEFAIGAPPSLSLQRLDTRVAVDAHWLCGSCYTPLPGGRRLSGCLTFSARPVAGRHVVAVRSSLSERPRGRSPAQANPGTAGSPDANPRRILVSSRLRGLGRGRRARFEIPAPSNLYESCARSHQGGPPGVSSLLALLPADIDLARGSGSLEPGPSGQRRRLLSRK